MIGMLTGHEGPLPALLMMTKRLQVRCMMVGSRDTQLDMIRAVEATGIHPVIDRTFPLEQLSDAFRYQESGEHFGKIVIGI